ARVGRWVVLAAALLGDGCGCPGDDRSTTAPSGTKAERPAPPTAGASGERPRGDANATTLITGGTVVDGTGADPIPDAALVIEDGEITAVGRAAEVDVPEDARRVDAEGGWILPGFVDTHVHFSQSGWLDGRPDAADVRDAHPYPEVVAELQAHPERYFEAYLCAGVTSVFDVGGYPWTRDLRARGQGEPGAVRVAAAGPLLSTVDFWLNLPDQRQFVFMEDETSVRETVRSHEALGSDAIKVWYIVRGDASDAERARFRELVQVAGEEADRVGLPLIVHATGLEQGKQALRAGAEVLVHSVFDAPVDDAFLQLARERDVVYTPTLTVMEGYPNAYLGKSAERMPYPARCVDDRTRALYAEGPPEDAVPAWARGAGATLPQDAPSRRRLQQGIANLRRVHEAGVTVATGTDAGNPGTAHGASYVREMELMARAGMSPMQVLIASTRDAATALGRAGELGTLEPGKLGDAVVLGADPLADITHAADVRATVKGGHVVYEREHE
ncbi:MAG: amidohydrolase family protein, partial [Polyangiales bacterium]